MQLCHATGNAETYDALPFLGGDPLKSKICQYVRPIVDLRTFYEEPMYAHYCTMIDCYDKHGT